MGTLKVSKARRTTHALTISILAAVLGVASAQAQGDLRSSLRPITGPVRRAGVYHVATGTWTRNGSLSNLTGPDTIYNNSCTPLYFAAQATGERFQHRSRVPTRASDGAPTVWSAFYGPPRKDEASGCERDYVINGFQISYCSSRPSGLGTLEFEFAFADAYSACGTADMVPDVTFAVSGLPGGTSTGAQICWVVDVDLDSASASFTLQADQDGTYTGPSTGEQFGFSVGPVTAGLGTGDMTGPVIAGNYSWTGGPVHGAQMPCTGTDGTIWGWPHLAEAGTGMASNDFFRATGTYPTPGCFYFGGAVHSDFYLKLFSNLQGSPCDGDPPILMSCLPGIAPTTQGCPCGQPNNPGGGCANFGPGATSGAVLFPTGLASLGNDTLLLTTWNQRPAIAVTNVFFTGSGTQNTGVPHGAGVRCVTTGLKRLYTGATSGGALWKPSGADPSISARCIALGVPISPGQTRHYFNLYRDPFAAGPCGNTASTVNVTNATSATWTP
jgi:hypothetical protein